MTNFLTCYQKRKLCKKKWKGTNQIKKIEVEGVSGGNLVKVVLTGDYELKSIEITGDQQENQNIINDLIIAAFNNAKENLKKKICRRII